MLLVEVVKKKIIIKGRPTFSAATLKNMQVKGRKYARRHILHWTDVRKGIEAVVNHILVNFGIAILEYYLDERLVYYRTQEVSYPIIELLDSDTTEDRLIKKLTVILMIAFSHTRNLVIGFQKHNLGIEVTRKSIKTIMKKLDDFCAHLKPGKRLKTDQEIKEEAIRLIDASLKVKSKGKASAHRVEILKLLKTTVEKAETTVELIRTLHDFQTSCMLDIIHQDNKARGTTKEQNIDALDRANKLKQAIHDKDYQTVSQIVF